FQTKYSYNALNKLVRVEQGTQVRRFRYDSLGRLTHQKLAETEATLNLVGQCSTVGTANDRWSDVFSYDERSNLIAKTDARGVKTIYKFKDGNNADDPLNRLQSVSYDTSGVPASVTVLPAPTVTYQYRTKASAAILTDVTQVRQVIASGVSTEDYDYDGEGRVKEKRLTFAGRTQPMTITYGYDALGRLIQTTYPQQYRDNITNPLRKALVPSYDSVSRIAGLKVNNVDYASQLTYNANSQITSLLVGTGPNQVTETYTYEERTNLLSSQSVKRGTTTLMSYSYGYQRAYCDLPGAICDSDPKWSFHTGQLTKVSNSGPLGDWKNQKFYYDELGRLKAAEQFTWIQNPKPPDPTGLEWHQRVYWAQNYSYDRFGNRTSVSASNNIGSPVIADGVQALTFDQASNRITTAGFAYDPAGNQTQNNSGQSLVYDAAGRLAKVKNLSGVTLATYTYGASNRRLITQTGNESSTDKAYYIWEGNSVVAEYTEQPSAAMPKWSKNYIYLAGRLLATEAPNGSGEIVQYHHPDRLGTKLVTNNLDTGSFSQANLPFGTALDAETTSATNRRFTSYDRSATTGLDYAINRHYDPRQGRFTQPDPLGMAAASLADPQSLNMYSYVGNDPVNRVDPDGQFWGALFKFIAGLFTHLKPNVITGSFVYKNVPPISVAFTPNFQNIGVGFAGIGFNLRSNGHWLPAVLGLKASFNPQNALSADETRILQDSINRASELLADPQCYDFINAVLQRAAYVVDKRWWLAPVKYTAVDGYFPGVSAIATHNAYAGRFEKGLITATGVSGHVGNFTTYGATDSATGAVKWYTEFFGLGRDVRGLHTVHEALHQLPGFTDEVLANAARFVRNQQPRDFSAEADPVGAASNHLNEFIRDRCAP
ncbi:MAG TPA: RHS repeat-associated core domain-containing protein, partial [Pyrinomonadaceae bacterium]|nr:RHS repeat-associated core domain-containing protein [Pyrinomonadaceae bacterium]